MLPVQQLHRTASTLRVLIVGALAATFVASASSGRAGSELRAANGGFGDSASGTVSATAIAAGNAHSCALTRTGGVKLGSRSFSIPAGRAELVKVKLTVRGFKVLVRVKRLSARVRISY